MSGNDSSDDLSGSDDRVCRHVEVFGRVQGVWFRGATEREANRMGVCGWVRNRSDGSVEAVFEGDAALVEQLIAWCHRGPSSARVDEVRVREEPVQGLVGFRIAY